jgi:acetylornithine deacetylase/succinyl-diaminopimelate desuccinylase-like protein
MPASDEEINQLTQRNKKMVQQFSPIIQSERVTRLAQSLVRIPSPLFEEQDAAKYLAAYLEGVGLNVDLQEVPIADLKTSNQVVARWTGTLPGPKIILCGHLDVLEIYRADRWSAPPYSGNIIDGWLYGQGSLNMKGGLAAIVSAVEALFNNKFELHGEIVLAGVMGEIGGGIGIQHLLNQENDFDYGIVAEPTNLQIANIAVGAIQGCIRLWGDTSYTKPHANPIYAMAKILQAIGQPYEPLPPKGWVSYTPCPDLPGFPRINVRKISSLLDMCEVVFDLRAVPGQSIAKLRMDFEVLINSLEPELPGIRAEIVIPANPGTKGYPAMPATPVKSPLVQTIAQAHKRVTGENPSIGAGDRIGLASDASYLKSAGVSVVDYGPGKHPRWPMWDERIAIEDILTATRVLIETLMEITIPLPKNDDGKGL